MKIQKIMTLAVAIVMAFMARTTFAASGTWTNNASGNWSTATNWSSDPIVPGTTAGDIIGFTNNITLARTVTIDTTSRITGNLTIGDSDNTHGFTLSASGGAKLTFDNNGSGAVLNELGSVADVISAPIILADNLAVSVEGNLTLSPGNISETGGAKSITKAGTGTLTLSSTSSYSGGVTLTAGKLYANGSALGLGTGTFTINGGGITMANYSAVVITNGSVWNASFTLDRGGVGGGSYTFNGDITLGGNVTITHNNNTVTTILNGLIGETGGARSLTISSGAGSVTVSGNNTYTGGTYINAGTLVVGSAVAFSNTGNIIFKGGTLQYTSSSASTDLGSKIKNSTSAITINDNAQNIMLSNIDNSNTAGLTKSGSGILMFAGTNTYAGATTVTGGRLVVDGGQITNNAAVNVNGGNCMMVITNGAKVFSGGAQSTIGNDNANNYVLIAGGSGETSLWNLGNQNLQFKGIPGPNRLVIDGAGVAGSAVVTNLNILAMGSSSANSSVILTNGARMFVNGQVRLGSPYYGTIGTQTNNSITITGGVADSIFYGNSGQAFYVGYGDRAGPSYNKVYVGAGGVLTNVGVCYVGHVSDTQNGDYVAYSNQVVVADGGKAFLASSLSVGYAQVARQANSNRVIIANGGLINVASTLTIGNASVAGAINNANSVTIFSGGQLVTSADSMIGRANGSGCKANNNSALISGVNGLWNLGGKSLYIGVATGGGLATGNVLGVSAGGMATNISAIIVSGTNTLSLGAGGLIVAGAVTNSGTLAVTIDGSQTPACGRLVVTGNLNLNNTTLDVTVGATATEPCVIASYPQGGLSGAFAVTNGLSDKYRLDTSYKGNQIAIVYTAAGTLIQIR